jgi:hypothetical protein
MNLKLLRKKEKSPKQPTKPVEKIPSNEAVARAPRTQTTLFQIPMFQQLPTLLKLRIVVGTIFLLCTLSLILIFAGGWVVSAILLLLGYLLLCILLVKLLMIKRI